MSRMKTSSQLALRRRPGWTVGRSFQNVMGSFPGASCRVGATTAPSVLAEGRTPIGKDTHPLSNQAYQLTTGVQHDHRTLFPFACAGVHSGPDPFGCAQSRSLSYRVTPQMARFLQDTVEELVKNARANGGDDDGATLKEFSEFMRKVRTGQVVSNDEIVRFSKVFNDELTLDNIGRPQLVSMCKYMSISPVGTDNFLRTKLRMKLGGLKQDDRMIAAEGVDSLSSEELRSACRARGMRWSGVSKDIMRRQLSEWLDLSLNRALPSSLLILSRAFTFTGAVTSEEALQAVLSSLPNEVVEDAEMAVSSTADTIEQREKKLEYLRHQKERMELEDKEQRLLEEVLAREKEALLQAQEALTQAAAAAAERSSEGEPGSPASLENINAGELSRVKESLDVALNEMKGLEASVASTSGGPSDASAKAPAAESLELARAGDGEGVAGEGGPGGELSQVELSEVERAAQVREEKQRRIAEISAALKVLTSSSAFEAERKDFLALVDKEIELYYSVMAAQAKRMAAAKEAGAEALEGTQGVPSEEEATLPDVTSSALLEKVNGYLQKLEKEIDAADSKIGNRLNILDLDRDGKVSQEELMLVAATLKENLGKESLPELIGMLDKDMEGRCSVEDIIRLSDQHHNQHQGAATDKSEHLEETSPPPAELATPPSAAGSTGIKPS
eukprot:jgi/Mesvir1/9699/Mv12177-RA.2